MEDQTLNPFRVPAAEGRSPRRAEGDDVAPSLPAWLFRELPLSLALVALIFVAYWGVWRFDFVYFDDPGYVTDNLNVKRGLPLFKDFNVFCDSVYWAFTAFEQSNWHPLTWLSHMLDVQLYGMEAAGHHVTNIIFHVCNALLLFWLLRLLTGRNWCSAAVAALFAVHPMHVESVVWVAERKDVLSTFLGLLTLLAYVRYTKRPNVERYLPVFVLLALGLLAKPMLVTLPCVCLLLDYWPLRRLKLSGEAGPPLRQTPVERLAVPRRRAKRNQKLPPAARAPRAAPAMRRGFFEQVVFLCAEKIPLFLLSAISAAITPYAQAHGGSMASTSDLSLAFRIENSLQSYLTYITRLFYPGKMSVLYLLDIDHVNHFYTVAAVVVLLLITAAVIWGTYRGHRYLAVGWFWYIGTLVPVIGIVQVGEQTYADRYTYIPYVGLFIMLVWGIADLVGLLPQFRKGLQVAAGCAMAASLVVCVGWTKYQLQFWTGVETHLRHALTITPDNWNMLNNLGVYLWKQAQKHDAAAAKADAEGDAKTAKAEHEKSVALKEDAMAQWIHGITQRPTATDIHSNLGYAYSEASERDKATNNLEKAEQDLRKAEAHLLKAVELKPISPRPRNNLGRVLLRRSQQFDAAAREAEAKGKTDPAEAARAKQLRQEAAAKLNAAVDQFKQSIELDPSLLEARLNLGEVYLTTLNQPDNAEVQYQAIVRLYSESEQDPETINNYSQGYCGLARIALTRKNSDDAIGFLQQSLRLNPKNIAALQMLARELFLRGEYHGGEKVLWQLYSMLPVASRRAAAQQFARQFEASGNAKEAVRAWNFTGWALATSPEPALLDPQAALAFARRAAIELTKQQDALSMDSLAAALAAGGQYAEAAQAAQAAIQLANAQGNKSLSAAISQRLQNYQQGKPYRCDINGGDRP